MSSHIWTTQRKRKIQREREKKMSQWKEKTEVRIRKRIKLLKGEAVWLSLEDPEKQKTRNFIYNMVCQVPRVKNLLAVFLAQVRTQLHELVGWLEHVLIWAVISATLLIWGTVGPARKWVCLCAGAVFTILFAFQFFISFSLWSQTSPFQKRSQQ